MKRRHGRSAGAQCGTLWVCLILAVVAGCSHQSEAPEEIRIGFLVDMPTPIATATMEAAHLAVNAVNAAGGIEVGGRPHTVTLLLEDTGDTPEGTIRASLKLINQERVVAIVGSSFSRNAIPAGEVAQRAGIPMICPGATHPQTTAGRRYVFRVAFVDSLQGRAMARFAHQELGLTTAAVLYDVADTYSRGMAEVFRQAFEARGEVVAFESFTSGESDFSRQLERIRDAGPKALFLPNFSRETILQSQQARRLGLDAVLLGGDGWLVDGLASHRELDGAFFSQNWHPDVAELNAESEAFIERYQSAYGRQPDEPAALTYDAFGLLFAALATAPRAEPESVRQALSRIEGFRGLTGPITYHGRGGDPGKNVVIVQIEDGELRLFKLVDPAQEE